MFTITKSSRILRVLGIVVPGMLVAYSANAQEGYGGPYNFGTSPSAEEVAMIDIDVMPDGRGLPAGSGTYEQGKQVYTAKCLACHGVDLGGVADLGAEALIGGRNSLTSDAPSKTIESYWPYASTVFDYIKRAMPFNSPGSLTDDEIYGVVAYILGEANIIDRSDTLDADTLAAVEMPNRDGFIADPRPDVFNYE
jgi:cytochrome c